MTLIQILKLVDFHRNVTIAIDETKVPMDAWTVVACSDFQVECIEIENDGFCITLAKPLFNKIGSALGFSL